MPADLTPQQEHNRFFQQNVTLAGLKFEHPVCLQNTVFINRLDLSQCRFERGVDFTGCIFEGGLTLADACIDGPLILNQIVIGKDLEPKPTAHAALLQRIVDMLDARLAYSVEHTPRQMWLQQRRKRWQSRQQEKQTEEKSRNALPLPVADFTRLRVTGSLSMVGAHIFGDLCCDFAEIKNELCLSRFQGQGAVTLRCARLGEMRADEENAACRVEGSLDLTSATVAGNIWLTAVSIGGQLGLQTADISGNLTCAAGQHEQACSGAAPICSACVLREALT